jgi:uncharacterized protein involved in outer membrane biogenesis
MTTQTIPTTTPGAGGFRSRALRRLAIVAGVVLLAAVLAWLIVPGAVKRAIQEQGSAAIGRPLTVEKVSFNPFTLSAAVERLIVGDAAGGAKAAAPLATIARVDASLSLASAWYMAPVLDGLVITKPIINVVRIDEHRFNFSDVLDKLSKPSGKAEVRFSIENIRLTDGEVKIEDRVVRREHVISAINLAVPFVSNLPRHAHIVTEPALSATVNGTPLKFTGKTRPFSDTLESTLDFDVRDLDVPTYLAYAPPLPVNVKSGKLDVDVTVVFRRAGAKTPRALLIKGGAALRGVAVLDAGGQTLATFESLNVKGAELAPIASPAQFDIGQLSLVKPVVSIARRADGSMGWRDVMTAVAPPKAINAAPAPPPTAPAAAPAHWRVSQFSIEQGQVQWRYALPSIVGKSSPYEAKVRDVNLVMGAIDSSKPDAASAVKLSFAGNDKESVAIEGSVRPTATASGAMLAELGIRATGLRVQPYRAYWRSAFDANIDGGVIDLEAALNVQRGADEASRIEWRIENGDVGIGSMRINLAFDRKSPFAAFDSLRAKGISIAGYSRRASIASVDAAALKVTLRKSAAGWNVLNAMPRSTPVASTGEPVLAASPPAPWQFELASLNVAGGVSVQDETGTKPLRLFANPLSIGATGLSTDAAATATVKLQSTINRTGRLSIDGTVSPMGKRGEVQVDARELDLAALDAFTTNFLNVELASGGLTYRGGISFDAAKPSVLTKLAGRLLVTNFLALDKVNGAEFARWRTLAVDGIDARLGSEATVVNVGGVALSDYYARMIVNANGRLNFQDVVARKGGAGNEVSLTTPTAAPASAATSRPSDAVAPIYRLGKMTLAGGNINFTDNFVRPNYTANLTDMTGTLSAVSSDAPTPATVTLRGRVDGDAPVAIDGRVNPLSKPIFLDMAGSAKGIELTRLTPYAAKYAGYAIDKGKLSMDIKYFVENNKLKADNRVFLDQLTFGDQVESPTATKLPVRLAVALLKNSRGEIDINLPIEGSIDDPEFSVGGIILQVVINLLSKAVTSPFALLGAAVGGGDELGTIEFVPGSPLLDEKSREKIEKLATALKDRPDLKLDITGRVDPTIDAEGIRRANLKNLVLAQKLKALVARGRSIGVDALIISPEEYPRYLEAAYNESTFPKPRNLLGMAKSLPVAEMETLILTNTPFTEAEQRKLSNERVDEVRRALRDTLGDEVSARVYVVAPKLTAAGLKPGDNPARVEFALRH